MTPEQVIVGPETEEGPWYFSLNNRRLWVLKRCREEGLLEKFDNLVRVRVRTPKSAAEASRYTLENCALEAKLMREPNLRPERKVSAQLCHGISGFDRGVMTSGVSEPERLANSVHANASGGRHENDCGNESDGSSADFLASNCFSALLQI